MKYGYKRGLADHRDHKFAFSGDPQTLPITLSSIGPTTFIFNQTNNDCVANSIPMAIKKWCLVHNYEYPYIPSRREIYYESGLIESSPIQDNGRVIRDAFKVINTLGVCPEDETSPWNWPYTKPWDEAPSAAALKNAALHRCLAYAQVNQDKQSIQAALYGGLPLVIGISVFNGIEGQSAAATGVVPMPGVTDAPLGGHALCVDSYDMDYISGPNSWGESWGDKGYYHLPWAYILDPDLTSDIWSVGLTT